MREGFFVGEREEGEEKRRSLLFKFLLLIVIFTHLQIFTIFLNFRKIFEFLDLFLENFSNLLIPRAKG